MIGRAGWKDCLSLLIGWTFLFGAFDGSRTAYASTHLKSIQTKSQHELDLRFDSPLPARAIQTEWRDDLLQLSIRRASVYPAKIIPLTGKVFSKVFAYQYGPDVLRIRLSFQPGMRTSGVEFQRRLKKGFYLRQEGELLQISWPSEVDSTDSVSTLVSASSALVNSPQVTGDSGRDLTVPSTHVEQAANSEPQLSNQIRAHEVEDPSEFNEALSEVTQPQQAPSRSLTGGKPLPPLWPVFFKLMGVLSLFLISAWGFSRFRKGALGPKESILGSLSPHWLRRLSGRNRIPSPSEVIEVLSTHHLDPKKSIAVVKVAGKILVLGVSSDAISLITQISAQAPSEDWNALDLGLSFDEVLGQGPRLGGQEQKSGVPQGLAPEPVFASEAAMPRAATPARTPVVREPAPSLVPKARDRIRNRLEGLKPL
jgi:flagellar biogenesis protein FliO